MNSIKSIFVYFFIIASTVLCGLSCAQGLKGNGNVISEERTVSTFTHLSINGVFNVFIDQGDKESVKIETDENLQDIIETIHTGSKLTIRWKDKASVKESTKMNVYVTVKNMDVLGIKGVGNVSTTSPLKTETMELSVSGVGNTSLEINCKTLTADFSAVGNIELKGTTDEADIIAEGTGNLKAFDLIVKKLTLKVSGIGNTEVHAEEEISITSSGVGNVSYKGNPVVKSMNNSGVGKVRKV